MTGHDTISLILNRTLGYCDCFVTDQHYKMKNVYAALEIIITQEQWSEVSVLCEEKYCGTYGYMFSFVVTHLYWFFLRCQRLWNSIVPLLWRKRIVLIVWWPNYVHESFVTRQKSHIYNALLMSVLKKMPCVHQTHCMLCGMVTWWSHGWLLKMMMRTLWKHWCIQGILEASTSFWLLMILSFSRCSQW